MKRVLRTVMMALLTVSLCFSTMAAVVSAAQTPVDAKIEAVVEVTGTPVEDAKATFKLTAIDGAPMPKDSEVTIPIQEGTNTVSFPITYTKVGVYEYTLQMISGTYFLEEYDGKVYHVKVAVTNSADYDSFEVQIGYMEDGAKEKGNPI